MLKVDINLKDETGSIGVILWNALATQNDLNNGNVIALTKSKIRIVNGNVRLTTSPSSEMMVKTFINYSL